MKSASIQIGSGATSKRFISAKAGLIDTAAKLGLPVLKGIIIPHEYWMEAAEQNFLERSQGAIVIRQPHALLQPLQLSTLGVHIVIRSAFSVEDTAEHHHSDRIKSPQFVRSGDEARICEILQHILSATLRYGFDGKETMRQDIIIMAAPIQGIVGTILTAEDFEDDSMQWSELDVDASGRTVLGEKQFQELPKLRRFEGVLSQTPAPIRTAWMLRVQKLLRTIRRKFGAKDWHIEWIDDGKMCYLTQLHPVVEQIQRNEYFTAVIFKEVLPHVPSRLMSSVIAASTQHLFEVYRQFDDRLPARRAFIEIIHGRPVINLSLLADMVRRWGMPTSLVSNSVATVDQEPIPPNLLRILRKIPVLMRVFASHIRAATIARRTIDLLQERREHFAQTAASCAKCVEELEWLYSIHVEQMFRITAALTLPATLLRQAGVLEEWGAHHQTLSAKGSAVLQQFHGLLNTFPETQRVLFAGEIPDNIYIRSAWCWFHRHYGHRGSYESDIAEPRFHEQVGSVFEAAYSRPTVKKYDDEFGGKQELSFKARLLKPLWTKVAQLTDAREEVRSETMRGFDAVRARLLVWAKDFAQRGVLPHAEDLWKLTAQEVQELERGWKPDAAFWQQRNAEIERLRALYIPDVFRRFDVFPSKTEHSALVHSLHNATELHGVAVISGTVRGKALIAEQPLTRLPLGFEPERTIVVVRSLDIGWVTTLGFVAGVVVETGGFISFGAFLLRSLRLPSVSNVENATERIPNGAEIVLEGDVVRILESNSQFSQKPV